MSIDLSKELNAATSSLRDTRVKLVKQRDELEAKIYKIDAVLEAVENTNQLQRIRHKSYPMTCTVCNDSFNGKRANQNPVCRKRKCQVTYHQKTRKKGIQLVAGDPLKAASK